MLRFLIHKRVIHILLFGLSCWGTVSYGLPTEKQRFITTVRKSVQRVNQEIRQKRARIQKDYQTIHAQHTLDSKELNWLTGEAQRYKIKPFKTQGDGDWQMLLQRVDTIPESLAIAQAIDESAWGTSRFAREANNLFGRWCYVKGCGIVPKNRKRGAKHEIKKFASAYDSIKDYVHNLNSNVAYQRLRELRKRMRHKNQAMDGVLLAGGLLKYSSRGQAYVHDIQGIIQKFHLQS